MFCMKNLLSFSPVFVAVLAVWSTAQPASAQVAPAPTTPVTLFNENFNGYTNFPNQRPVGDNVNFGIPSMSEGASEFWYASRFEFPHGHGDSEHGSVHGHGGTIDSDLAVQKFGGLSPYNNPVARFEDDAGIVLRIDTTGYQNVNLSFDWRTFLAGSRDQYVVGYHIGDNLGFDTSVNRFLNLQTGPRSWEEGWVELMRKPRCNLFHGENFSLPENAGPIYVAFWLNGGEGDYGKLDNVLITAAPIPEPAALTIVMFGIAMLAAGRKLKP
jgi:hypothetical protein